MHRHHPYGGTFHEGRRTGSPPGSGPDRNYGRFDRGNAPGPRGRGRGGRGGGNSGYGGPGPYGGGDMNYEQNGPSYDSGDPYNQWGNNGVQDPYYNQNSGYGGDYPSYGGPPGGYEDQNYGSYEDGPPSRGRGGRRGGGPPRRERDEKGHDSLIEERINRERPCRTLFIRNIKYETESDYVRKMFEEHGEIKTFFDRIANRGMVFVTYYDLRAAERARERLQDTEISGRPIDVHYSLPRPDEEKDQKEQNTGTILVTLHSPSGEPIDDNELRRRCQQFGDVKNIKPGDNVHSQRFVEYFDVRGCEEAFEHLRHQPLQSGTMEVQIVPDIPDVPVPPGPLPGRRENDRHFNSGNGGARDNDDAPHRGRRGGRGRNSNRGAGGGGGPRDDWDRRDDDWDRGDRRNFRDDYDGPPSRGERGGRGRGGRDGGRRGRGGGGGGGGGYNDRQGQDSRNSGGYGGPPGPPPPMQGSYGPPGGAPVPPPPGSYGPPGGPPGPQNSPPVDDRLQQARKVQELLAALKQPQTASPTGPPGGGPPPPAPAPGIHGMPPYYPLPGMPGGPPPPPGVMYPGAPPPPNPYGVPPPPSTQPAQSAPPPGLPPNLLAMLQHATQGSAPPPMPYGVPTPGQAPPGGPPGQDYQQIMSYLQTQANGGKR